MPAIIFKKENDELDHISEIVYNPDDNEQPESITPRKLQLRELLVKDTSDNPFNFSASFGDMKQYFAKFGDSKDSDE